MEDLLRGRRALLVCGKSGLGKTREAVHLAQMLNNEGWTVLFLPPGAWLEPPARLPQGVPNRKVLLFLDDLSRRCYSARREVNPRAESLAQPLTRPFQERLLQTIEAFEAFCGKSELLILATTRNERTPEYEGEPAEWDKLEWERYRDLWARFVCYELPEPDPQVAAGLLSARGAAAGVRVEAPETLARRNDGTLRNLVENLRAAANPERGRPALTPETFVDTLRGTWQERYRRACERYPAEAPTLYWSAALLRRYGFPLEARTLLPLARELLGRGHWWSKILGLRRALRYLTLHEGLTTPRDGQLEAAGPPPIATEQVIEALIRIGFRHRLAEALHTLARELMWPDDAPSSVYHPAAARILRQVTAWQPENSGAWYYLGVALADSGEREQAIAAYQKAIELDPKYAYPWNGLGNVYYQQGRHDQAIAAYQKAIELDPKYAAPWNGLGNVYYQQGRHDQAIAAYQKAIELDPKLAAPWNGLGNVYLALGRHDQAIVAYQKAIELDPQSTTAAFAHNNLAGIYIKQHRFDLARRELSKRIQLHPANTFAPLIQLGVLARHQGLPESEQHFKEALSQWERAWQDAYQSKYELLSGKSLALLCLDQREQALQTLKEALAQREP